MAASVDKMVSKMLGQKLLANEVPRASAPVQQNINPFESLMGNRVNSMTPSEELFQMVRINPEIPEEIKPQVFELASQAMQSEGLSAEEALAFVLESML